MRRGSHDMQVNVAGIRRNLKNFAHNYSDAQKKVREATSNDPWGPSSTIMAEIADLTYNVVAFSEIMQMVWKRLNDHGRNWRHVYKALVLLEYLIKTGSEKVGQQCKENIFAIQTLKDFQYLEGKDQGQNVREKAKQLVNLLKDDERLKNERTRALKAKERFAQSASGFGSDGGLDTPSSPKYPAFRGDWGASRDTDIPREIENARPQTAGEEELQLQLALAMSREEAEQEEQKRKSDDVRLQLALSQSQQDFKTHEDKLPNMVDLLDVNLGDNVDPWGMPQPPRPQSLDLSLFNFLSSSSPWQTNSLPSPPKNNTGNSDPWQPSAGVKIDAWGTSTTTITKSQQPVQTNINRQNDPWSPSSQDSSTDLDEFDIISNRNRNDNNNNNNNINNKNSNNNNNNINNNDLSPKTNGNHVGNNLNNNINSNNNNSNNDPFELTLLGDTLPVTSTTNIVSPSTGATKKTPQSFLGENSSLVNLDNLVTSKPVQSTMAPNPFSDPTPPPVRTMFNTPPPPKPSINEIKQASFAPFTTTLPTTQQQQQQQQQQFGIINNNNSGTNGFSISSTKPDPWTPVPSSTNNQPWINNSEPANPFLS